MKYCFIYVNYFCEEEISKSILSITMNLSTANDFEFVVIDNSSSFRGGSVANVRVFENLNMGFGHAVNVAAKISEAEILIISNPDIVIEGPLNIDDYQPGSLQINGFLVRPTNYNYSGNLPIVTGCFRDLSKLFILIFAPSVYEQVRAEIIGPIDSTKYVNGVIVQQVPGCFFLIRRCDFYSLTGYDEKYFLYYEDTDLFYRASRNQFVVRCFYVESVFHRTIGDVRKLSGVVLRYFIYSMTRYYAKRLMGLMGLLR